MDAISLIEAHSWASSFLKSHNIEFPDLEAELLICNLFDWDKSQFFLYINNEIAAIDLYRLKGWLERRANHEPLQYIIGSQDFYGRQFTVNPNVLIPRPETELLVEALLNTVNSIWSPNADLSVVDVGSGSGAIAITLALEKEAWNVYGIDISSNALDTAKENANKLNAQINFLHGNLLQPIIEERLRFDIIVSNPPYIPSIDIPTLMPEVSNFEPRLALDGGIDGLDIYRELITQSMQVLKRPGLILFEVGINQAEDVSLLLRATGANTVELTKDYQGIDRIVIAIY